MAEGWSEHESSIDEQSSARSDDNSDELSGLAATPMQLGATPLDRPLASTFLVDVDEVYRSVCRISWVVLSEQAERIFADAARLEVLRFKGCVPATAPSRLCQRRRFV